MLRFGMRGAFVASIAVAVLTLVPAGASAQYSVQPWDGANPFACTLQQVGTGTNFPQPGADPFCVEFDKTHQNVDQLGVVDFLSKEPARVAAASPKCFYFQSDHWTGSIQQGQPPETYHWDGHYFFDKARGIGGAYVENFRVLGQSGDPTTLPGFPASWKPYFSNGRGGVQTVGDVPADPNCAKRANPAQPGSGSGSSRTPYSSSSDICRVPGGSVDRTGLGGVRLGARRRYVRQALGLPQKESARYMVWCFDGGGRLVAALRGPRQSSQVDLVYTDASPFDSRGVRPGSSSRAALRRLHGARRLGRAGSNSVLMVTQRRLRVYVGVAGGRVSFLAVSKPRLRPRKALRYLRALPS
jgi:hypothetical protein